MRLVPSNAARRRVLAARLGVGLTAFLIASAWASDTPQANASGVFLNADGDVLTAAHAVSSCKSLYLVKGTQVAEATVRAASPELDLAVLHSTIKPYLSATLVLADEIPIVSVGVFAEAYETLQQRPDRTRLLSNAMTVPGDAGLQLISDAKPGASGAPVLGSDGLLLGMVVERVAVAPHASGTMLSRAASSGVKLGATQVRAVPAASIRGFLIAHDVRFAQSASPQLSPLQSPAARASTLSVGVLCG